MSISEQDIDREVAALEAERAELRALRLSEVRAATEADRAKRMDKIKAERDNVKADIAALKGTKPTPAPAPAPVAPADNKE